MEFNRLLEIASEKEMCDLCVDGCDEKCFKCKKAKGIRSTEIREYHAAVMAALRRIAEYDKAREGGAVGGAAVQGGGPSVLEIPRLP